MRYKLLLIGLAIAGWATAQTSPAKTNLASFYFPGTELAVNKVAWNENNLIVQYSSPRIQSLEVFYSTYSSYRSKSAESEELISATCTESYCYFTLDMTDFSPGLYHFIRFKDVNTEEEYFEEILPGQEFVTPILITDTFDDISLSRYFKKDTEIYFKALDGSDEVIVYHYNTPFKAADPPTGLRSRPGKNLTPSNTWRIDISEPFILEQEGLYFVQTDPSSNQGYGFRVQSGPYPTYNSLTDLKQCMIYISTSEEWGELSSLNTKKEFDEIWLKASGNENNAKAAIRMYYRNIATSNRLFTSFKEGWKTDKGMILSVFGAPTTVTRDGNEELWVYDSEWREEDLSFTFTNQQNIFSPYHSILHRKKDYGGIWHFSVDKLRQGIQLNE